ncbi:hypothetical protein EMIT0357P_70330 [Pseudomonas marginalis]
MTAGSYTSLPGDLGVGFYKAFSKIFELRW